MHSSINLSDSYKFYPEYDEGKTIICKGIDE